MQYFYRFVEYSYSRPCIRPDFQVSFDSSWHSWAQIAMQTWTSQDPRYPYHPDLSYSVFAMLLLLIKLELVDSLAEIWRSDGSLDVLLLVMYECLRVDVCCWSSSVARGMFACRFRHLLWKNYRTGNVSSVQGPMDDSSRQIPCLTFGNMCLSIKCILRFWGVEHFRSQPSMKQPYCSNKSASCT